MPIHTVLGPIEPDDLGPTSMHEHLLVDGTVWHTPAPELAATASLTLDNAGPLRWSYFAIEDNLRIDDPDLVVAELRRAKDAGASGIVDLTVVGLGRQVAALPAIAARAGVHIMVGCGIYIESAHPSWVADVSVDDLTEMFLRELETGIDDTDVRAALIGEIGTSDPIADDEWKVLRAAAAAAAQTGSALNVHQNVGRHGFEIIDLLVEEGVAVDRIVLSHMDDDLDLAYQLPLVETGVIIEFDTFGHEVYPDRARKYPTDAERLTIIAALLERGFVNQITLGCDVWTKGALRAFGGMGYEHLFRRIVPELKLRAGASDDDIEAMLVRTPRRLLDRP